MKPLTVLCDGVDADVVARAATLFERLASVVLEATGWEGDPPASFRPKGGSGPSAMGTTKGWMHEGLRATLWSDGLGFRIAFRIASEDDTVQTSLEMPRTLTFLRNDAAVERLLRSMAARLRAAVPTGHPREVAATAVEDGLMAALSVAIAEETSEGRMPSPHVVRLPSPLKSNVGPGSIATRRDAVLLTSRAFDALMRRRIPSTLMVSPGDAENGSDLAIVGATRFVDVRRPDPIERLRLGIAAEGHVPQNHPPLVEWHQFEKDRT